MTPFRRRILAAVAIAVPVLLAAAYGAAWQILAERWRAGIAQWARAQAAEGGTVTTGAMAVSGFPGAIRLTLAEPAAKNAAGDAWAGPPLTLAVTPWRWHEVAFEDPGAHRVTLAGQPEVAITAATLTGTIAIEARKPVAVSLAADTLTGLGLTLGALTLDLRHPAPEPDAPVPTQLVAQLGLDRLTLPDGVPLPLDRTIAGAHLAARLRGPLAPGPRAAALAAWRDGGGTVELDSFDLSWPPLALAGEATLALDPAMQPEGAGTVNLRGGPAAIDQAVKAGMMDKGGAQVAKIALLLASKPTGDGDRDAKLAVTVQNRVLSVGPVPLLQLPEVNW